jgi:hypothetical protein
MQLGIIDRSCNRNADGAGSAAQVNDQRAASARSWPTRRAGPGRPEGGGGGNGGGLPDQELAATPGHEDALTDRDPEPAELGPAEDVLERETADTAVDHGGKICRRARGGGEHSCLVLGEHAARRAQLRHDRREVAGRARCHQGSDVLVKWVSESMSDIL